MFKKTKTKRKGKGPITGWVIINVDVVSTNGNELATHQPVANGNILGNAPVRSIGEKSNRVITR